MVVLFDDPAEAPGLDDAIVARGLENLWGEGGGRGGGISVRNRTRSTQRLRTLASKSIAVIESRLMVKPAISAIIATRTTLTMMSTSKGADIILQPHAAPLH